MEQKVIILYARPWDMVDENTKEHRTGVTIQYLMTDNLSPRKADDDSEFGICPTKESISVELAQKLVEVPGIYKARLDMKQSKQQTVLKLGDIEFIGKTK